MSALTPLRQIKSYVIRQGRISRAQQEALTELFAYYASKQTAKTSFEQLFSTSQELVVEIGFGMGAALLQHAQQYPHLNFIGIEVHPPGIGTLLNLIHKHHLNNLHIIQGDATLALEQQCPDQSLARVNIFFPDPWPKQRHHKRRLLQPEFVRLLTQKLKPQGYIHLATDWADYAHHIERVFAQAPNLKKTSIERGDRPQTKFEQKGLAQGHRVFDFIYTKTN
jgi:tRNA (guanine-N7-)-methyltransferase